MMVVAIDKLIYC